MGRENEEDKRKVQSDGGGVRKEETGLTCFSVRELADTPQRPSGKERTACRSWLSSSTVGLSGPTRAIGLDQ